jgi:F420-dependent oxidoreductase-like protein
MAAMTMDHLSGGRFILGIGASGPQVVEGWYGQPYPRPLERTREYVQIMRQIFAREKPVEFQGKHYTLPYPGGAGLGKPLKSTVHPLRSDIPIYLAAEGPKNVALAAEIADGWLPLFFSPKSDKFYRESLSEGFARPEARHAQGDFEIVASVPVIINDDVEAAANAVRPMLALYVGGMGAKGANFHYDVLARLGYDDTCAEVQRLYLSGDKRAAMAAIPTSMVEDVALIGPLGKIKDELPAWKATSMTTMLVGGPPPLLRTIAELVLD